MIRLLGINLSTDLNINNIMLCKELVRNNDTRYGWSGNIDLPKNYIPNVHIKHYFTEIKLGVL